MPSTLAEGSHTIRVLVTDAAGNIGTATSSAFTLDVTAPTISTLTGPANCTVGSCTNTLAFSTSDALSAPVTTTCAINSAAATTCTNPYAISSTTLNTVGAHTISVTAHDRAGNTATRTHSFTIASVTTTTPPPTTGTKRLYDQDLQIITRDLEAAHPGLIYENRPAVVGGAYPYSYALLQGPTGMSIHSQSGKITFNLSQYALTAPTTVIYEVKDSTGLKITRSYTLTANPASFVFVSPTGGTTATGTLSSPYNLASLASAKVAREKLVYFMPGEYVLTSGLNLASLPRRWLAYPGSSRPHINCNKIKYCINGFQNDDSNYLFRGFEFSNSSFKLFNVDTRKLSQVVWQNNIFHNLHVMTETESWENPSFIYFWDNTWDRTLSSLQLGNYRYKNMVMQNNEFFDFSNYNNNQHASSTIWYDVQYSLFEENSVHDFRGGFCMHEKDDGWFNTIRNNICYNIGTNAIGITLSNQYTAVGTTVNFNLIVGPPGTMGVKVGSNPGYDPSNTAKTAYQSFVQFITGEDKRVIIRKNLVHRPSGGSRVLTWSWGSYNMSLSQAQSVGVELNSVYTPLQLSADGTYQLPTTSPYYGQYGWIP